MNPFASSKNDSASSRVADEQQLAQSFLSILQGHHQEIRRHPPQTATSDDEEKDPGSILVLDGITEEERKILSRTSYQNWTAGSAAGAATLGLLMGLTWRASRGAARHALPRRPPAAYRELDRRMVTSSQKKKKGRAAQQLEEAGQKQLVVGEATEAMDPTALGGEVMSQVQWMVYGATSIVVTVLTSWWWADREAFYRNVGRLPLQRGASHLCQRACPDLVEHYRELLQQQEMPGSLGADDPEDLLRHPQTAELDSMWQLVLNCQQRSQFLRDHGSTPARLVAVPLAGVPFNYLGLSADDPQQADVVDEYDWLRRLVVDGLS